MAIYLTKFFPTEKERDAVKKDYHKALIGTPAYERTEIAIVDEDEGYGFTLCVGNNNDDDLFIVDRI